MIERHIRQCFACPFAQHLPERDRAGDAPGRHHFLDPLDHEIDQRPLGKREQIAQLGRDHRLDRRPVQHFLQGVSEVFEDDDDGRAGILELMLQFAGRVQGINVHHDQTRAQDAEQCHRILQHVGHHQGDPLTLAQTERLLQPGPKRAAQPVNVPILQGHAHVGISRQIAKALAAFFQNVLQRTELVQVRLSRHAR